MASNLCCGLCRDSVSSDRRRRKILHGPGCVLAKEVLLELAGVSRLESFPTIGDPGAVLCHSCELILNNIKKFEEKVADLKTIVKEKISALQQETLKRCCSDRSTDLPQAKHLKIGTSSSTATAAVAGEGNAAITEPADEDEQPLSPVKQSPNVKVSS